MVCQSLYHHQKDDKQNILPIEGYNMLSSKYT